MFMVMKRVIMYRMVNKYNLLSQENINFFYIYYDTTKFNINITINVDYNTYPSLICRKKCKKCKKCTCYTDKNNGYLVKDCKSIPVYTKKIIGTTITQYLYPEFGYLRDLFYNTTLNNSLPIPVLNTNINNLTTTIINCGVSSNLWCNYTFVSGNLVTLYGIQDQLPNQMYENRTNKFFRYSWPQITGLLTATNNRSADFIFYYYWGAAWYVDKVIAHIDESGTLSAGSYVNQSGYPWIAFGIDQNALVPGDIRRQPTGVTFPITITEE